MKMDYSVIVIITMNLYMLVQQPLSFQLHEVHLYIYRNPSQGQYYYDITQMLMNAMRGQMDVSRNVSTPMGLTTVLVEQATDLFLMVTLALVKDYAEMPFLLHSTQFTLLQILMSAVRKVTGVNKTVTTVLAHMHAVVIVVIISMKMD